MDNDPVNHPAHYCLPNGAELIDIIEGLPYNRGAAIKYIFRAGVKDPTKEIEDLRKAAWMIQKELERIDAIHAREGNADTGDGRRDRNR